MSEVKRATIKEIVQEVNHTIFLPAIQRKLVWNEQQMKNLMDSIMRGYPFGTFLFWKINRETQLQERYSLYQFIKDYDERDLRNNTAPDVDKPIIAVLDGQQRLSTLYIALQGTFCSKLPYKRRSNENAYPKRKLYFNLRSSQQTGYEFDFLTNEAADNSEDGKIWVLVSGILMQVDIDKVIQYCIERGITQHLTNATLLYNRLANESIINYYEYEKPLDDMLEIFVRVNSGGTVLSKSDLLFSKLTVYWPEGREEIDELLDHINKEMGYEYKFTSDYIMRTCLYLIGKNTSLNTENFTGENVQTIKDEWNQIYDSIVNVVKFLARSGFSKENIKSYNAIIPIVYYYYKNSEWDANASQEELKKYFILAQLKQIFGSSTDSILEAIRKEMNKHVGQKFYAKDLYGITFLGSRTLRFTEEDLKDLFEHEKDEYTFMVLTLLYPNLQPTIFRAEQDHMHPSAAFKDNKLVNLQLPDGTHLSADTIKLWQHRKNTLPNLQLLEKPRNSEKNAESLKEWIQHSENKGLSKYLPEAPEEAFYDLSNFDKFWATRKSLMEEQLRKDLFDEMGN